MRITLVIEQSFDIEVGTLLQAYTILRQGYFPTSELLLKVRDERGLDITAAWQELTKKMRAR
jgi:hypothetical protein